MISLTNETPVSIPILSEHSEDGQPNWKAIGRIYEHLACYYLSSVGIAAEIKDGAGYDLLCETPTGAFFKVEVKSSTSQQRHQWSPRLKCYYDRKYQSYCIPVKNKGISDVLIIICRETNFLVIKYKAEFTGKNGLHIKDTSFTAEKTQRHLRWLAKVAGSYTSAVNGFAEAALTEPHLI